MVEQQIARRGVRDRLLLSAMRAVPRERFVEARLQEFAYDDTPLPIEAGQTISQPYVVALMLEAAGITPGDRVLEVGAGSGYAAAVLGCMAGEVFAIERHEELAARARERIEKLGYANVQVLAGDGSLGLPAHAPFDVIIVSAGGPDVPRSLLNQLAIGGRLIIPVGDDARTQTLLRIRRVEEHRFDRDDLGRVQFVPLVGAEGWSADGHPIQPRRMTAPLRLTDSAREKLSRLIAESCEPIADGERPDFAPLLERIGEAQVVLIGESTHGTREFYELRARLTRELIEKQGFSLIAIEGDWPDVSVLDRRVRGVPGATLREPPFARFPSWMWRNESTAEFLRWLSAYNGTPSGSRGPVRLCGLDLYSLNNSIGVVLEYLQRVDPETAESARVRYGCFSPWETDPATYGRAVAGGRLRGCEREAVSVLTALLMQRLEESADDDALFDAERNAIVVREAERYYRAMYYGSRESWNLRDEHMFDTLQAVLTHHGPGARAVVWAHNTHVGNAAATEMGSRGEISLGQLVRQKLGRFAYSIGFGTDRGEVLAASNWNDPAEVMRVRPSHPDSYERLCHESGVGAFLLPLAQGGRAEVRSELLTPHLERAIGVIYRPETEILSHYFQATLPTQFDEYIWCDRTTALKPLPGVTRAGDPDLYPFGL